MEYQHNKRIRQVSARLLYTLIIFLAFKNASGQRLSGKFVDRFSDGSRSFTFYDHTFEERTAGDINGSLGRGTYSIRNGVLTLNYQAILTERDSSNYTLEYRAGALPVTVVTFKMFDEAKAPMEGTLTLRDKKGVPIAVFESTKDGSGTITLKPHDAIGFISLESRGYNSVLINVARMRGAHYDLIAHMVPYGTYYTEPKVVKYKILQLTQKQLGLRSVLEGWTFNFSREK